MRRFASLAADLATGRRRAHAVALVDAEECLAANGRAERCDQGQFPDPRWSAAESKWHVVQ
jgi:hypothetical protein